MSIFYKDKPAFESKKFKMTLISLVAIIITPLAAQYFGPVAPTLVSQVAPYLADFAIAAVTYAYVKGQAQVDAALATVNDIKESAGVVNK